jgi:hypothetical protein
VIVPTAIRDGYVSSDFVFAFQLSKSSIKMRAIANRESSKHYKRVDFSFFFNQSTFSRLASNPLGFKHQS